MDGTFLVQPDRRRPDRKVQDHLDARLLHHVHDLVKPRELEPAVGGFVAVPGEMAHANHPEPCGLHQRDVPFPVGGRRVMRVVVRPDVELLGAGGAAEAQQNRGCEHQMKALHLS